jgi:hypothetical protein
MKRLSGLSQARFDRFHDEHFEIYKFFIKTVHAMRAEQPGRKFGVSMVFALLEVNHFKFDTMPKFLHVPTDFHKPYALKAILAGDVPADIFNLRKRKRTMQ